MLLIELLCVMDLRQSVFLREVHRRGACTGGESDPDLFLFRILFDALLGNVDVFFLSFLIMAYHNDV